jgi:hypothetical protein
VNVDDADGGLIVRPAVWRLIWEDTRYLDGTIPVEEHSYFPPVAPMEVTPPAFVDHDPLVRQSSEQLASRTGSWALADRLDVRRRFQSGDKLPQHEGRDVTWIWVGKD